MRRSFEPEILDGGELTPAQVDEAHRALSLTHALLGNHRAILKALRDDDQPLKRVLDIGCGHGGLLRKIRRKFGVEVVGADLQPPGASAFPILRLDAVRDRLPHADVAVCVCMAHHLTDEDFMGLIANVRRSCRRFVILDLVRHTLPLALFKAFAPLCLPRVNVLDGGQSIRRAYTPAEFGDLIGRALREEGGTFAHHVSHLWIRQIADIQY